MRATSFVPIAVLLMVSVLLLTGCVSSSNTAGTNSNGSSVDNSTDGSGYTAPTSDQVAGDLSGGTGSGSGDISDSDLDSMQNDLDNLDTSAQETQ